MWACTQPICKWGAFLHRCRWTCRCVNLFAALLRCHTETSGRFLLLVQPLGVCCFRPSVAHTWPTSNVVRCIWNVQSSLAVYVQQSPATSLVTRFVRLATCNGAFARRRPSFHAQMMDTNEHMDCSRFKFRNQTAGSFKWRFVNKMSRPGWQDVPESWSSPRDERDET